MKNRTMAVVQIGANSLLLILLSAASVLIAVVFVAASSGVRDSDRLASNPDITGAIVILAVLFLIPVIVVLWLARKYAVGYNTHAEGWELWFQRGPIGIIARFAWRGIQNGLEVKAAKEQVRVNKRWSWISFVAGCVAAMGCLTALLVDFVPLTDPYPDADGFVTFITIVGLVLFFCGINVAFRIGSHPVFSSD
jgi:hypothetical protein